MKEITMTEKKLYTTAEAAHYLGFSAVALRTSRSTKILAGETAPAWRRVGKKSVRYHVDDLDAWIAGTAPESAK